MKNIAVGKYTFTLITLLILLTGCDGQTKPGSNTPEALPTKHRLTIALSSTSTAAEYEAVNYFASLIEKQSDGQLVLNVLNGKATLGQRERVAALKKGDIDFTVVPSAKVSHLYPGIELFDLPFFFTEHHQVRRVYASNASRQMLAKLQDYGLVGLAFWDGGFKQLVTNAPLSSKDQFLNKRFRIVESTVLREQFKSWGGLTLPISTARVSEAYANGDLDGEEMTLSQLSAHRRSNLQVNLTRHGHQTLLLMMSAKTKNRLPEQLIHIIDSAAKTASTFQYDIAYQKEKLALLSLREDGVINVPSNALLAWMKTASAHVIEHQRMQFGTAMLEQVIQAKTDWENLPPDNLIVALDADMFGSAALSGLAIRRGIELALEEINQQGGILGKEVRLMVRNNSMVPSRGLDNIALLSKLPNVLAVFSGISSPVVLAELNLLHEKKMLMLVPWAAATPIVSNGYAPNFVFRVSVRDEYAAQFLLEGALKASDKVGFFLVNNGWGRSNFEGLSKEMEKRKYQPTGVQWFDWGEKNMETKIRNLINRGAKAIIFVGNAVEGEKFVTALARYENPPVVYSHWGITGSTFAERSANALEKIDLRVLQTFSFIGNDNPAAKALMARYHDRYGTTKGTDIFAPSGTAHAYDLMHMLAIAANKAGSTDMAAIQKEMTQLEYYQGVMKTYRSPFKGTQDALTKDDYLFAFYKNGTLHPLESSR
ncbi:TRAP transporter substrate-binding protein DctP [Grimontia hollisae]|uniref:TRAP transporter substrate-binding protein DctP n=1 Tax=Grimontia hollisae TaxID=673 RepID=UPI00165DAC35|nr:TRAP transporter substrate-binding protein DctP [Grimontia hollisae]